MQKQEFEERIERTVTDEQYKVIEEVYMWHQGKEGFMKVTRIQDKYNPDKVWMIKRYLCGTFYVNQEIKGQKFYDRDRRMTKRMLVSIGVLA